MTYSSNSVTNELTKNEPPSTTSVVQFTLASRPEVFNAPVLMNGASTDARSPDVTLRRIMRQYGLPVYDSVGLLVPLALKHCSCANREFSGAIASVISTSYQSNDAVRFSRLPGPCSTTPNVNVSPFSGWTLTLPWRSSISSGKNGLPGRAKALACALPGKPNADELSFDVRVSLLLMMAAHSACVAVRF